MAVELVWRTSISWTPQTFQRFFTARLEPYGKRVGPLIFEFGTFNKSTFPTRADFMARLDPFLKALPQGFRYAVEIRNHGLSAAGLPSGSCVAQRGARL